MLAPARTLSSSVTFDVQTPSTIAVQVCAATSAGGVRSERLGLTCDDLPLPAGAEVVGGYGGRIQVVSVPPGLVRFDYFAELEDATAFAAAADPNLERLVMLRPSRYCPSDHVVGFATSEFGTLASHGAVARAVARWIFERVGYVAGSSGVHDSAEDTLLTARGVCRDFAHLGVLLCRASGIPARFAAVYAPGLDPMDFHAVFEAWHDDGWWAYDASRMAPRPTLVRVATGRDAADTAFATVVSGIATLVDLTVTATSGTDLPLDDHEAAVALR